MSHGPEHEVEHAEHAAHAVHDSFNRSVTMSIAIVAAVLACVTMLGHRSHNDVLRLQGEALHFQTLAGIESTRAAKHWQYYQAKNLFHLESSIMVDMLKVMGTNDNKDDLKKVRTTYQGNVDKYDKKLPAMVEEGKAIEAKIEDYQKQSQERMTESHVEHGKAERLDYGELGLQLGVVLCSLAILTRSRGFWFAGIASSLLGTLIAMTGQFAHLFPAIPH